MKESLKAVSRNGLHSKPFYHTVNIGEVVPKERRFPKSRIESSLCPGSFSFEARRDPLEQKLARLARRSVDRRVGERESEADGASKRSETIEIRLENVSGIK